MPVPHLILPLVLDAVHLIWAQHKIISVDLNFTSVTIRDRMKPFKRGWNLCSFSRSASGSSRPTDLKVERF